MRTLRSCLFFSILLLPAVSLEQEADAGADPDAAEAPLDEETWRARFADASGHLARGEYELAIAGFTALVPIAPTESLREQASAQLKVTAEMQKPKVPPPPTADNELPPDPNAPPTHVRSRSLDELIWIDMNTLSYGLATGVLVDAVVREAGSNAINHVPIPIATLATTALATVTITVIDSTTRILYGVLQSITSGMNMGLEQGAFWSLWDASRATVPTPSYLHTAATIWGFTTAGVLAGGVVGGLAKATAGQASWVGTISLWPALILGSGALAVTARDDLTTSRVKGERNFGLVGGLTQIAGIGVAAITAVWIQPSVARARFIDVASFVGGILGVVLCTQGCSESVAFGGIAIGATLGFATSLLATQWLDHGHVSGRISAATPTITPVNSGATFAFSGAL